MKLTRTVSSHLESMRRIGFCPSSFNLYVKKYSFFFLINDILAGIKVFLIMLPINLALSYFCGVSLGQGLLTCAASSLISILLGGSKYQISSVSFVLSSITLEILSKYQYEGLVVVGFFVFCILILFGIFRLSNIIKHLSYSLISSLSFCVAIIVMMDQAQRLLGISIIQSSHGLAYSMMIAWSRISYISSSEIISFSTFIVSLLIMKIIFRNWFSYTFYLLLWMIVSYLLNIGLIPEDLLKIDMLSSSVDQYLLNDITTVSFCEITKTMITNSVHYAFVISIIIAIKSCFCINISNGITGDAKLQHNADVISSGISNFLSIILGGLFSTPHTKFTICNIGFKGRTIIPLITILSLFIGTILFYEDFLNLIPKFCLNAILFILSFSYILNKSIKSYLNPKNSDFYVFIFTLIPFIYLGFISASICGFFVSTVCFFMKMININDANVHTTKNHDTNAIEFMTNKYGFSNSKNIDKKILKKVEMIQIQNTFHLNTIGVINEAFVARGNFPSVIIIYFRNIPFIDTDGFSSLKKFSKSVSANGSILIISGTNGMLLEILKQKAEKEERDIHSYGYVVPSFEEAIRKATHRLK